MYVYMGVQISTLTNLKAIEVKDTTIKLAKSLLDNSEQKTQMLLVQHAEFKNSRALECTYQTPAHPSIKSN